MKKFWFLAILALLAGHAMAANTIDRRPSLHWVCEDDVTVAFDKSGKALSVKSASRKLSVKLGQGSCKGSSCAFTSDSKSKTCGKGQALCANLTADAKTQSLSLRGKPSADGADIRLTCVAAKGPKSWNKAADEAEAPATREEAPSVKAEAPAAPEEKQSAGDSADIFSNAPVEGSEYSKTNHGKKAATEAPATTEAAQPSEQAGEEQKSARQWVSVSKPVLACASKEALLAIAEKQPEKLSKSGFLGMAPKGCRMLKKSETLLLDGTQTREETEQAVKLWQAKCRKGCNPPLVHIYAAPRRLVGAFLKNASAPKGWEDF